MWKSTVIKRTALRPLSSPFFRLTPLPRRHYSQEVPPVQNAKRKRFLNIGVAFLTGASIYFFLPDPRQLAPSIDNVSLSPTRFTPTRVISNDESGPHTRLLKVAVPPHLVPRQDPSSFAPIWSVFVKDDDIQVERPYTPLHGIDEKGHMLFWIKKYPNGEVGRWLHTKRPGSRIDLRGPTRTWPWVDKGWDEVVMISGGTGVTPFVQLFNTLISKQEAPTTTKFTLIHGSPTPAELPPAVILEPMVTFAAEHPDKFNLHLLVEVNDGSVPPVAVKRLYSGRVTEGSLKEILGRNPPARSWRDVMLRRKPEAPKEGKTLYLVCGPEGMITAVAGPYGRNYSQGPVGGILRSLGCTSDQVYKL